MLIECSYKHEALFCSFLHNMSFSSDALYAMAFYHGLKEKKKQQHKSLHLDIQS